MALSSVLQKKADAMDKKEIICPFCFGKFHDNEVIFRSSYLYKDNQSIGRGAGMDLFDSGSADRSNVLSGRDDDKKLFTRYDGAYDSSYRKRDFELENFWDKRGRESGFQTFDPAWFYPHIDPKDPNQKRGVQC